MKTLSLAATLGIFCLCGALYGDADIHVDPITNTPITDTPITDTPIKDDPITNTPIEDSPIEINPQ